ncbi:MAG TPA: DUF1015 family protein [Syntrophales bacterium]|nr:DUF1015 family protein [Syntrophales bacterium]HOX94649.1 DUF1015 family protein [Syntrophales bacterium]HPI56986.1 DUF1015 family protein [Syntrophales bacterium]HPN23884.1 DUF1015 family protein [Syntrophales bacterium]HQM29973.1 DUF1015 family protein [Syntrophales bacterium]
MAIVVPFRALRPKKEIVRQVASHPYDVLDWEEARRIARDNPLSFLRVEKSEIDLRKDMDTGVYGNEVYRKAKKNLDKLIRDGVLVQDRKPCFYIYRQSVPGHTQYGIVGGVSTEEYDAGLIKKHELTMFDKEDDRTKHIDIVNAQTGLVFLVYRAVEGIDRIVADVVKEEPEYEFKAEDGVSHTVWVIDDEATIERIRRGFSGVECLYIADGHHRAASAAAVARRRRESGRAGEHDYFMATLFPDNQLRILDYNRVVKDLNGMGEAEFIEKTREGFRVAEDFLDRSPVRFHEFGMYLKGRWYRLTARESVYVGKSKIGRLDVSILQDNILRPLLGIQDPRTDRRIRFVGGVRGMKELERLVDSGQFAVAFSMYPPTLAQLMEIADAGEIMPPKSTWFEPKLRSGIFVHILD